MYVSFSLSVGDINVVGYRSIPMYSVVEKVVDLLKVLGEVGIS